MSLTSKRSGVLHRASFTLVELLVAMALMTILTGSIVFIFMQSQEIFRRVDAQVQVYQYARYAFDQIERDLANVVNTQNMEFFNDFPPPNGFEGRYDPPTGGLPGEQLPIRGTVPDGNVYRYAFTMRQEAPYKGRGPQGTEPLYRKDSVYFKTVTMSGGETFAALVEYALLDTGKERPRLVRKLWRVTDVDTSNPLRHKFVINGGSDQPVVSDLCLYAVESQFEIFVRNRRFEDTGRFLSTLEMISPELANRTKLEASRDYWRSNRNFMVMTYYDQDRDLRRGGRDQGVFDQAEKGLFKTEKAFTFPMLRERDQIFISGGGLQAKAYTIKAFVKPNGQPFVAGEPDATPRNLRIQFEEPIEWPSGGGAQLKVNWQTAYLPPALRMTVKIKDAKSQALRTVQRVFKILTSS